MTETELSENALISAPKLSNLLQCECKEMLMAKRTLKDRFESIDDKSEASEEEEIWDNIRLLLVLSRVSIVILTVLVSEIFEETYLSGLSLALWAPIIGIPLFFLVTALISIGDRSFKNSDTLMDKLDEKAKESVVRSH